MNKASPRHAPPGHRPRGAVSAALIVLYGALLQILLFAPAALTQARGEPEMLTVVALGDSLTAGFGLAREAAFPRQLEAALRKRGHKVRVINAGVSGDTTAAGLARLDWALGPRADAVILELGANDALRGLEPGQARANLDAILTRLREKRIPVLIAGMLAPRNLGPDYASRFDSIFPDLAKKHGALLYPFFLEGVAGKRALNLPDGLHPNARGVAVIVARILPYVEKLLARAQGRPARRAHKQP
ncbi:MAG: arylesterase [Alphaproteobacteria bacterium]|nr:MAG: arylesterase [Alphaproteobacteria bacterium]